MSTLALFPAEVVLEEPSTDAQCTPRDLALDLGVFGLDPCSNPRSHIQALRTYQLERGEDGLALPWTLGGLTPASVFVNGPYSNPLPWCERLRAHRAPWACLWKMDSTTKWFAQLMIACDGWAPFRKRLAFELPGNCGSADFSSVLVWGYGYEPSDALLARVWPPARGVTPNNFGPLP